MIGTESTKMTKCHGLRPLDIIGTYLFSFDDGKTVYSVFGGGKNELTEEQLAIFKKENPTMYELYLANKR